MKGGVVMRKVSTRGAVVSRAARVLTAVLLSSVFAQAQSLDWPQWGGPHRNFVSDAKGLAVTWPEGVRVLITLLCAVAE